VGVERPHYPEKAKNLEKLEEGRFQASRELLELIKGAKPVRMEVVFEDLSHPQQPSL